MHVDVVIYIYGRVYWCLVRGTWKLLSQEQYSSVSEGGDVYRSILGMYVE